MARDFIVLKNVVTIMWWLIYLSSLIGMGTENWIVPFFEKCTPKCTLLFFEICTLAHKMWNPEARDSSSPTIFTIMSSWERPKVPPLPGRRGTRRSLWKRAAACWIGWAGAGAVGLTVKQSIRWGVHSPTHMDSWEQDAAAAPPGRRGTRDTRVIKSTAAEELAPVLGECGKS